MSDTQLDEIRRQLDKELSLEKFEDDARDTEEAATQFFQDLFVQLLNFDMSVSATGQDTWHELPAHRWRDSARANAARLFAEARNFRVVYVELDRLTRTAERNAIQSLTRSDRRGGWAIEGSFLTVFHAPDEETWHLVTPYEEGTDDITTGRPVLRRYTLGEGETHRTIATALQGMDASQGRLAERIDEAFSVKPVTEDFYEDYKSVYDTLSDELRNKGLDIEEADQYAHVTLNRLMFFYYLQKKGWIGDRKDFVHWFLEQYEDSADSEELHEKWLSTLFFDGMNQPAGESIDADLPEPVEEAISGIPYMNGGLFQSTGLDKNDTFLSDAALNTVIRGFLEQYNFTVTEESAYDIDVAVDPAMLGKIYESLIAEEDRGDSGIFYTPRTEVDLMCRFAIYEQLTEEAEISSDAGRKKITDFVFSEPDAWEGGVEETSTLEQYLEGLDIVDPACGSGAFLVGMVQVLSELYRKCDTDLGFEEKRRIINSNIYGVDIKDWAVRVAEFRLWLSLIETSDTVPDEQPVLPNFSFNLQTGDSIIQRVGDRRISVRSLIQSPSDDVQRGLSEVEELKQGYFEGERSDEDAIKRRQTELLKQHISEVIRRKDSGEQQTLTGDVSDSETGRQTQVEIERLTEVKDRLDSSGSEAFFLWELSFSEVMLNGGFDIVIGNPPYIGNEFITDPSIAQERLDQMDDDQREEIQDRYKQQLGEYVEETYGFEPDGQSDYYAHFFFKGLEILDQNGTLSYITSDKWLDRGYGSDLQEVFLTHTDLKSILANRTKRSFEEADITTAITTVEKRDSDARQLGGMPRFISCSEPYSQIVTTENIPSLLYGSHNKEAEYRSETLYLSTQPYARVVSIDAASLWQLGGGQINENGIDSSGKVTPQGSYDGDKWGSMYIRAPDTVFEILETQGDRVQTLENYGVTSYLNTGGAKKFYVVERVEEIGDGLSRIRNREYDEEFVVENQFLKPFLGSPRDTTSLRITTDDPGDVRILSIPPETDIDSFEVHDYIQFGEEKGYSERSGPSRRSPWWKPPSKAANGASIVLPRTHNDNHRAFYNPEKVITGRFYRVDPEDSEYISLILNSTFGSLFFEIYGDPRGQGALDLYTGDYGKLPVIEPDTEGESVPDAALSMLDREPESVFEELGAETPEAVELAGVKEDRRELDRYVMADVIGLSEQSQLDIYKGLLRLVDERLSKADSV
ncbi:Eco57I restriction-modification methylase domain-containing protein [Halorussus litoreus]|uniref:Eco57I restriction-modification methylase domain-containing protein n=1 Tax=Halorussus litoreus TaxID=1710536 RepID=UPI0018E4E120|nr:DNA methyltransferase [Halorussus litoreus]